MLCARAVVSTRETYATAHQINALSVAYPSFRTVVKSPTSSTAIHRCRAVIVGLATGSLLNAQPATPRRPTTDRYPGTTIVDPYRWMERPASAEFARWLTEQDAHTSGQLSRLPGRAALAARVSAAARPDDAPRRVRRGGQRLFYMKRDADSLSPTLRWYDLESHREQALPVSAPMARYDPSPDGRLLAATRAGDGRVLIVSAADARIVDSLPPGATFAGWRRDADAVLYAHIERSQPMLLERRLSAAHAPDSVILRSGRDGAPRWLRNDVLAWHTTPTGKAVALLIVRDESIVALHVSRAAIAPASRRWRAIAARRAELTDAAWYAEQLFMLGRDGLTRYDPATQRTDTVRTSHARALLGIAVAKDALYLLDGTGGVASVWRWRIDRPGLDSVPLAVEGAARSIFASRLAEGAVLPIDRWLGDGGWYHAGPHAVTRLAVTAERAADERFVVERRMVRSHDGTSVPMTIVRRRDLAPGTARLTWLMAYGAYGIALTPVYQSLGAALVPFLEDGGVYAVAHVRGGGEFGRMWHEAGRAAMKPNGYRDLIACAESLVAAGMADPAHLVIEGASGGGATVGMAGMLRPELFRVVITNVPDANTLRLHATPDGPYTQNGHKASRQ